MDSHSARLDSLIEKSFANHQAAVSGLKSSTALITNLGAKFFHTVMSGKKILVFGNGGSAADAPARALACSSAALAWSSPSP